MTLPRSTITTSRRTLEFWTSRRPSMWFPIRDFWTNLITMASTAVYTHGLALFFGRCSQKVAVDGHKSKPAPVASRVPQGTVFGPPLFLLFINDMPSEVTQGTKIRLFVDDCLIYRPIHCLNDQLILQWDIDQLMDWADHWGMRFNAAKCNVMRTLGGIPSERFTI